MIVKLILVIYLVAYCTHRVECLECYSCTDVAHVSDCNTITQCPAGNICQARFASNKYTLGCIDLDLCSTLNTSSSSLPSGSGPIIGRSVTSSLLNGCSDCCDTGNCNRQLCQIHGNACGDSGSINCSVIGTMLNICADKDHAKTICKRFCGLCEVDGKWSSWSEWTACSRSCGNGTESRFRSCSDPAPANGGNDCTGTSHEIRACSGSPCPVNGGWSSWSEWGGCSVTCGVGIQRRDRLCSSPYPSHAGSHCFGDSRDDRVCLPGACQDGGWSTWGVWESCSRTCDGGIQKRSRTCDNPSPSLLGQACSGDPVETQQCALKACSDGGWSTWGAWESCSRTCDGGIQKRLRTCDNPSPSHLGQACIGYPVETQQCALTACSDGGWSTWGVWESCSRTCDGGIQKRSRTCENPSPSLLGQACSGYPVETQQCALKACSDGNWNGWGSWASCSNTCGGGIQTRSRSCTNPAPSALGHYCTGDALQVQPCSKNPCLDEKIGFSVRVPEATSHSDRIRFTYVVSNEGAGYSTATGEFSCTVSGMYYFSVTLSTAPYLASNSVARCDIYKNLEWLQDAFTQPYHTSSATYYSATGTVYIHLTAGDTVYLGGCTAVSTMSSRSDFTGFLVKSD